MLAPLGGGSLSTIRPRVVISFCLQVSGRSALFSWNGDLSVIAEAGTSAILVLRVIGSLSRIKMSMERKTASS